MNIVPATRPADACEQPLRVAFFSDAFPERNGTGAYYHDLLPQLAARLDSLAMFQPSDRPPRPLLSIAMPGDPNQRLEGPPLRRIGRHMGELQPDVVVVVTPGLYGLLGAWYARRRRLPLVAAFHTDFERLARLYWPPLARWLVNLVVGTANRLICRRASRVLINNAGLTDAVRAYGADRVQVVGTPLPLEFLERPRRAIPGRLARVCFAGRLAPEKNVDLVIEAARDLPAVEFVIGGEGPLRQALETQAAGLANVRFTGWLDRSALIDLIDSSSLLLLPSRFETFGSIALEAMARGRPALVSTAAGIHDWPSLRPGLVPFTPGESLADCLRSLQAYGPGRWELLERQCRAAAADLNGATIAEWHKLLQAVAVTERREPA
ncbi:glycosyltransferase [Pseudohaliea sp.]|uniref:glycosyltransferase n=1 Tax=Pseudohaliea sp. TaxID=2740289 RepID=UPI0032ECC382